MTDHALLHRLLGHPGPDPGCEACFEVMDQVAEAQAAGEDVTRRFPEVAAHLHDCPACREDLEGLRAYLQGSSNRP
jgi:hypothetical protein